MVRASLAWRGQRPEVGRLEAAVVDTLLDTPHSLRLVNTAAESGQFPGAAE